MKNVFCACTMRSIFFFFMLLACVNTTGFEKPPLKNRKKRKQRKKYSNKCIQQIDSIGISPRTAVLSQSGRRTLCRVSLSQTLLKIFK